MNYFKILNDSQVSVKNLDSVRSKILNRFYILRVLLRLSKNKSTIKKLKDELKRCEDFIVYSDIYLLTLKKIRKNSNET